MTATHQVRRSPGHRFFAFPSRVVQVMLGVLVAVGAAAPLATEAQPVLMTVGNASIFEGNSGTKILKLPVNFAGTNTSAVTGFASAAPLSGTGFHPAGAGASCTAGVDFVPFSNAAFNIPPNTPNGTLSVNITICGDTTIELDEHIIVSLTGVAGGAFCTSESCAAIGTIIDDDGTPSVSVGNISVSEPAAGLSRTVSFPVTLSHPTSSAVSVRFATRDGTAKARTLTSFTADYIGASGTLNVTTMPTTPGESTAKIDVTLLGDSIQESSETFFVDLSSAVNATILGGTAQATIRNNAITIGAFDLSPDNAVVENGDTLAFDVVWTVPDGENWHDLKSLDFRIGDYGEPVLWVRWDEASNTFSLCEVGRKGATPAQRPSTPPENCALGAAPGSADELVTPSAQLVLADTTVTGSGPTGLSVTLHLVVSFGSEIGARTYPIWLSAGDDFGNVDKFVRAGEITVE